MRDGWQQVRPVRNILPLLPDSGNICSNKKKSTAVLKRFSNRKFIAVKIFWKYLCLIEIEFKLNKFELLFLCLFNRQRQQCKLSNKKYISAASINLNIWTSWRWILAGLWHICGSVRQHCLEIFAHSSAIYVQKNVAKFTFSARCLIDG